MNPNPFTGLLHSRKFWLAVVGLVQTVLFQFVPGFPREVWLSVDGLLAIVIASIAYEDGQANRGTPVSTPSLSSDEERLSDGEYRRIVAAEYLRLKATPETK